MTLFLCVPSASVTTPPRLRAPPLFPSLKPRVPTVSYWVFSLLSGHPLPPPPPTPSLTPGPTLPVQLSLLCCDTVDPTACWPLALRGAAEAWNPPYLTPNSSLPHPQTHAPKLLPSLFPPPSLSSKIAQPGPFLPCPPRHNQAPTLNGPGIHPPLSSPSARSR